MIASGAPISAILAAQQVDERIRSTKPTRLSHDHRTTLFLPKERHTRRCKALDHLRCTTEQRRNCLAANDHERSWSQLLEACPRVSGESLDGFRIKGIVGHISCNDHNLGSRKLKSTKLLARNGIRASTNDYHRTRKADSASRDPATSSRGCVIGAEHGAERASGSSNQNVVTNESHSGSVHCI